MTTQITLEKPSCTHATAINKFVLQCIPYFKHVRLLARF